MKRYIGLVLVGIVSVIATLFLFKDRPRADLQQVAQGSGLSDAEKQQIRIFWEIYNQAVQYRLAGQLEEAAAAYEKAIAIEPAHKDALYYGGNVNFELGNYEQSIAMWQRLTEINPLSKRAHVQLGTLYSCGVQGTPFELERAEEEFKRSLTINKEESGTLLKLGGVYILMGKLKTAESYLKTALKINFKSIEAVYLLGYINWKMSHSAAAQKYFAEAVGMAEEQNDLNRQNMQNNKPGTMSPDRKSSGPESFFSLKPADLTNYSSKTTLEKPMADEYSKLAKRIESAIKEH